MAQIVEKDKITQTWAYAYDASGRRLSKRRADKVNRQTYNQALTYFTWDGARLLQEQNQEKIYTYIYSDQDSFVPLAQVVENLANAEQTSAEVGAAPQQLADTEHAATTISEPQHLQINYFHTDQVGIVKEVSNLDGKLIWHGNYSAWGKLIQEQKFAPSQQPFRLQNQYFDQETGLHYNLMRYYDASCGRFINQDPIGLEGGANLYQFAPNASGWVDPLGLTAYSTALGTVLKAEAKSYLGKKAVGKVAARFIPFVGWAMTAYDVISIGIKVYQVANKYSAEKLSQRHRAAVANGKKCDGYGGDCTPDEFDRLNKMVDDAKAKFEGLGGCKGNMIKPALQARIEALNEEIKARGDRDEKCFAGGDSGHKKQIEDKIIARNRCQNFLANL